jgi:AraC-like DNA-binding protein
MKTHYQHPIRLEEVAKTVGMTPAYLSHFISKNLGVSFQDYLTSLRFEHALRMIDRDLPLGDISGGSGFSDLKYMNKAFLKKTGMTPSEYRKRNDELRTRRRSKTVRGPEQVIYSEEQSAGIIKAYLNKITGFSGFAMANSIQVNNQ